RELDRRPHVAEGRERGVQQVVGPAREVAVGLHRGGDEPQDRREHDEQDEPREHVQAAVDQPPARAPRQGQGGHGVTSRSRRNVRYQIATHTNIASIKSVDAAAPKPNRLFENDWRTIRVIIRSASLPGFEPSITYGIANW